jgi:hypothetical protein
MAAAPAWIAAEAEAAPTRTRPTERRRRSGGRQERTWEGMMENDREG